MDQFNSRRKYTQEEKQQLIANLDIEVAHRTRQFHSWLADALENFTIHQEGHILRIPKQVRNMTMREFGQKYNGDVQDALRGAQKERLAAAGESDTIGEIMKSARKRKWNTGHDAGAETPGAGLAEAESSRPPKNARLMPTSPSKPGSSTGPGTTQHARLPTLSKNTSSASHAVNRVAPSPSPRKPRPPFVTSAFPRTVPSRPTSPQKPSAKPPPAPSHSRVPSLSKFNPSLPPGTAKRLPRRDESMLSVNGSPLANPYDHSLGWFKGQSRGDGVSSQDVANDQEDNSRPSKQSNSIVIRRDTSTSTGTGGGSSLHSRTNSQASLFTHASSSTHSRTSSEITDDTLSQPVDKSSDLFPALPRSGYDLHATPKPSRPQQPSVATAMVAIPTKDGHLLEFDPLQTSPGSFDALEGITDSAKKHAKDEMIRLVQATVDKWKVR